MTRAPAVCSRCGCLCDDLEARVEAGRIVAAERACPLGLEWLRGLAAEGPAARVDGRPAPLERAAEAAAGLLAAARSPLVYGLTEASAEAQAIAVALADRLGAVLDPARREGAEAWTLAFARGGSASATLGEIRNRADLFLALDLDVERSHPRFLERFFDPPGLHLHGPRRLVQLLVRGGVAPSPRARVLRIPPERALAALWALRALLRGRAIEGRGLPLAELDELAAALRAASWGVWLYDAAAPEPSPGVADAVLALARETSERTPFAVLGLTGRGNPRGADAVLTAHAGYPFAVSFAAGHPRHDPGDHSAAALLQRGEADAALVVECDPAEHLPPQAAAALEALPAVVVAARDSGAARRARVAIRTAPPGIGAPATLHRMDGIALHARPVLTSALPSDAYALALIEERVRVPAAGARGADR